MHARAIDMSQKSGVSHKVMQSEIRISPRRAKERVLRRHTYPAFRHLGLILGRSRCLGCQFLVSVMSCEDEVSVA